MATPYELFAPSFSDRFNAAPATDTYDPSDPTYAGMAAGTRQQALKNLATMLPPGQPPIGGPPISGPQQSYNTASNLQGSGDGSSGQAGRMESSYNNSPYSPSQPSQTNGTIGNTGAPQANSQAELVGQGARGWNIYQTTPTWTGSPNSQSPEARSEGDFKAPPISGPNPVLQRQQALRQQLIARAFQNMPRGYQFKLG